MTTQYDIEKKYPNIVTDIRLEAIEKERMRCAALATGALLAGSTEALEDAIHDMKRPGSMRAPMVADAPEASTPAVPPMAMPTSHSWGVTDRDIGDEVVAILRGEAMPTRVSDNGSPAVEAAKLDASKPTVGPQTKAALENIQFQRDWERDHPKQLTPSELGDEVVRLMKENRA